MFKVVRLQMFMALISILGAAMLFGLRGAISAGIGSAACVLPNLGFAWFLHWTARSTGNAQATAFFIGEAVKMFLSIGILVVAALAAADLHWGALMLGLIVTLQANVFAFLVKL